MSGKSKDERQGRPTIEWVFGFASAAAVLALVGFLGYEAAFGDSAPPDLVATVEKVEQVSNGSLVMIAVENKGDDAAAEVGVQAVVEGGGEDAQPKELMFDYIPSHAMRRGAFVVESAEVDAASVRLTVHGYVEP